MPKRAHQLVFVKTIKAVYNFIGYANKTINGINSIPQPAVQYANAKRKAGTVRACHEFACL
jgi:hypothetical protein